MIRERLDEWYLERESKMKEGRPWKLGPSNLGDCLRKTAWILSGAEQAKLSPETLRIFDLGHQRGERFEAACLEIWPDAQAQVPVNIPMGRFSLKGTMDLWIPSERLVVDFKTVGSYGAGLLDKEGPSLDYQLQVHAYRHGMDIQGEWARSAKDIRCLIVYEAKDSDARKGIKGGALLEREVPWTQDLDEVYHERLMALEGLLIRQEQGTLDPTKVPELPLEKGKHSWKCKYCSIGEQRGQCYQ